MHDFARSSRIGGGKFAVCLAAAIAAISSFGDVAYLIDGNTLTVTASSAYAKKGLKLLWDTTDKGNVVANWSNSSLIVDSVPPDGGTYTIDLAALGITNEHSLPYRFVRAFCPAQHAEPTWEKGLHQHRRLRLRRLWHPLWILFDLQEQGLRPMHRFERQQRFRRLFG